MSEQNAIICDPVELVRQLDVATLRERLDANERERQALMVLLRAARRAEKQRELMATK